MSKNSQISRRKFLRTLTIGVCVLPFAKAIAKTGGVIGLHPDTPMGEIPAGPLTAVPPPPPSVLEPAFYSAKISSPNIAMTFDDGPHPSLTPRLLDMLSERNLKATFYVIGQNVKAYPAIARRIVNEGHEIANHTWTHPALSKLSEARVEEELRQTHEEVLAATGYRMTGLRPPYGATNDKVRKIAFEEFGYRTVMWSVDPLDWKYRNSNRVMTHLVAGASPGAVLLAHDIHPTTVAAMPTTFDRLMAKSFQFVTLHELREMERAG